MAVWMSHPRYGHLVQSTWNSLNGTNIAKFDKVCRESIVLNKEVFGNIFHKKRLLEARIEGAHHELDVSSTSLLIKFERGSSGSI